jgi:hypothetical protein
VALLGSLFDGAVHRRWGLAAAVVNPFGAVLALNPECQ